MAFSDAKQCTAKAKSTGERCKNPAVSGRAVCRLHGGKAGRPIVHGRDSLTHRQSLAKKAEQFAQFNGDLAAEVQLLRALLQDYLDRYEDGIPLPRDAIEAIYDMVDGIGRMEQRRAKIRHDTAFGAQEMQLFISAMSAVLKKYVSDDDLPEALSELRSVLANH